jgi:hypothetical protein
MTKENIKLKKIEELGKVLRLKYNEILKEKMEMEELILKQEEQVL